MGEVKVPASAYYGASTARAIQNFQISGQTIGRRMIRAFGLLKGSVATVADRRSMLSDEIAKAIRNAADEVMEGKWDDEFPVDVFQTGSGTSTNTNVNEVIANRAIEILGGELGSKTVHPNDQVNIAQSSNDAFPTVLHLAATEAIRSDLIPSLDRLAESLGEKATEFSGVVKSGRTHLMDAVPVTLGQEFSGYETQIRKAKERILATLPDLAELPLGGTAVGTGINCPPGFAAEVIALIAERTGFPFVEAPNHFEAQGGRDAAVSTSGALKGVAVAIHKISNDLRWMSSGPVSGLGEIRLPDLQPGSSIMPAKVNPVIPEAVMMVAAQIVGNDAAIAWGGASGTLELNTMMPLIARNLIESIELLATASRSLAEKCVEGICADQARMEEILEQNVIVVTALNPHIGYDSGSRVAKRALAERRSIREIVLEEGLMTREELDRVLDWKRMT